jgi:hypothetical protein
MQDVSRGTMDQPVEDLAMSRSIVPCGTILHFSHYLSVGRRIVTNGPTIFAVTAIPMEAHKRPTLVGGPKRFVPRGTNG